MGVSEETRAGTGGCDLSVVVLKNGDGASVRRRTIEGKRGVIDSIKRKRERESKWRKERRREEA